MFIKKFFGVLLLLVMIAVPQSVSAEKTDWFDRSYNFHNIRSVILFDVTFSSGLDYGGSVALLKMQDTYLDKARKLKCNIITEAQARQTIGYQLSMDLDSLARYNPARTVWEQKRESRTYYDAWGNRREETFYVQVPVTYPPRRVYVSSIQMTLQLYEARTGSLIFARKDVRDREDYQAQDGMFGRIVNSFFEDAGNKIR